MPLHTNTIPLYIPLYQFKTALDLNIGYGLSNPSLGFFQTCSYSFSDIQGPILVKLPLQ